MKKAISILFAAAAVAALCFVFSPASSASGPGKKDVTFSKDVAPIFFKNCAECHKPNDIAPMSLLTYKEARPWARSIKEKVASREMPPWSPDPHYGQFSNEKRLTDKEVETIVAWVDSGAKEGNPKDMPPTPEFARGGWSIGKPDAVLEMGEEWTIDPNAPDNYINFFIPTNFKEDRWVQAAEILPGNRRVVHHVIAFIQSPQMMAKRAEAAKASNGRVGGRAADGKLFYLDGTLRRVKMDAPVVTAKGADLVAKRIREIAQEHRVPIMENPPLARTLYAKVELDQAIPPNMYAAVAQVIAFVYKLKRKTIA